MEMLVHCKKNIWRLFNKAIICHSLSYLLNCLCIPPHITLDTRKQTRELQKRQEADKQFEIFETNNE